MTLAGLLVFCGAYFVAAASPGPGIAALVARVLARGLRGVPAFIAGFVVGDLAWFAIAAAGLALVAQTVGWLFVAIKWAGVAYLLWMAWKLWSAPVSVAPEPTIDAAGPPGAGTESGWRLFGAGLALTLGNPKVIVFFMALLPTVVDLAHLDALGFVEIAAAISLGLSAILGAYALAAARARRLFATPRAMRALNRVTGTVMAGAAVSIATRS